MSIKPVSRDATITVVWIGDPAIDQDAMITESVDNGEGGTKEESTNRVQLCAIRMVTDPECWKDLLEYKNGDRATEFVLGVIPPDELNAIEDDCRWGSEKWRRREMYWRCFEAALRDIRHGPQAERMVGKTKKLVVPTEQRGGVERVEKAWIEEVFCHKLRDAATSLGGLAYRWNQLGDVDAKN